MRPALFWVKTLRASSTLVALFWLGFAPLLVPLGATEEAPEQVRDLNYGTALYQLYQGQTFEALSTFSVAQQRGGIAGHGDYPALVEGSLMLEYGLLREARVRFQTLLAEAGMADRVAPNNRNQAWFYLGKVFYLEQDLEGALDALNHVEGEVLQHDQPELFEEWRYLVGRVAQRITSPDGVTLADSAAMAQIEALPEGSLWRAYLSYNQTLRALSERHPELASAQLQVLIGQLQQVPDQREAEERLALTEQCLLTLGQLFLQQGQSEQALASFKQIRLESVFSDQALFGYAVAAANLDQFGLALEALTTLRDRPSFTPWLQQVPYAMGYVYERLHEPVRALRAYQAASQHYQQLTKQLAQAQADLTEQQIVNALTLRQASLGDPAWVADAYGRLPLEPVDFSLAQLFASETFQLSLRDLHELYALQSALKRWAQQLESLEAMLATREQLRRQRLTETATAMEAQQASRWLSQQQALAQQIEEAGATENLHFFSNAEQSAAQTRLQRAQDKLQQLPEGPEKAKFSARIERLRAYLDWWLADSYGVNRWQAEKQLLGLTRAVEEFKQHQEVLTQELSSNQQNTQLAQRIEQGRARLHSVSAELEQGLATARQQLLEQVRAELTAQSVELKQYLLASHQAQARLSDDLYRATLRPAQGERGLSDVGEGTE